MGYAFQHEGCTPVFTHGSKFDAVVDFGAVFQDFTCYGSLPPTVFIYTAEPSAIFLALLAL